MRFQQLMAGLIQKKNRSTQPSQHLLPIVVMGLIAWVRKENNGILNEAQKGSTSHCKPL
jgi:hypothetical protein